MDSILLIIGKTGSNKKAVIQHLCKEYNYKYCDKSSEINNSNFYLLDVEKVNYFLTNYKGNKNLIIVEITSPIYIRIWNMLKSKYNLKNIITNLLKDKKDFEKLKYIDYYICNYNLYKTCLNLTKIIVRHKGD